MDPQAAELQAMANLNDVFTWVGIGALLQAALNCAMGTLTMVREVVLIPLAAWDLGVAQIRIVVTPAVAEVLAVDEDPDAGIDAMAAVAAVAQVDRPPSAMELGQVASLRRVCRLRLGLSAEESGAAAPVGACQLA